MKTQDSAVREGAPDALHQLRVAARRMRAVPASFRKLTDRDSAELLRVELQWLAGAMGAARDLEVMRTHLNEQISAEPQELVIGPVKEHLEDELGAAYEAALAYGLSALGSDRYFRLLDALDGLLAAPPFTERAKKKAPGRIGRLANAKKRRPQSAARSVNDRTEEESASAALHEVRKARNDSATRQNQPSRFSESRRQSWPAPPKKSRRFWVTIKTA